MTKIFKLILGLISGSIIGLACAFIQAERTTIGNITIPYGFVLALSIIVLMQLWLGRALQSRLAAIGLALGWVVVTLILGGLLHKDEVVIASTWYSKAYVFGGAIILGMVSALPALKPLQESHSLEEPFTQVMKTQQPPEGLED